MEVFKQYIESSALHQTIASVEVRDPGMLNNVSEDTLVQTLRGRQFKSTRRREKFLFLELDDGNWLVLHYGMTGEPKYFKDLGDDTDHDRMLITFENGYHLAYDCTRKRGEINVTRDVESFVKERELGPDVCSEAFDRKTFLYVLKGCRATVKSALIDQHRMAGIGNVYADEIRFQTGLHPKRRVSRLDGYTLNNLYKTVMDVLEVAIDHRAKREE